MGSTHLAQAALAALLAACSSASDKGPCKASPPSVTRATSSGVAQSMVGAQDLTRCDPSVLGTCSGFGTHIHFVDPLESDPTVLGGELKMLSNIGVSFVRTEILDWSMTEQTRGVYDFSAPDGMIATLLAAGIRPVLLPASANPLYGTGPPITDEVRNAMARWAVAAVQHYQDKSILWQFWNEPNNPCCWAGAEPNPDDYAAMVRTVGEALRQSVSDDVLIGPDLSLM